MNSQNYFSYKRNKIKSGAETRKRPISKLNFLFQLFAATFIIMFIIIVVGIMKYSSKMDIEYSKGDLSLHNYEHTNSISGLGNFDEEQRKIDKRLILIQQEENAPSEARITDNRNDTEVIAQEHIEKNQKIEKSHNQIEREDIKEQNKLITAIEETVNLKPKTELNLEENKNITIVSKVLIGRYTTFEEARKMQNEIKADYPELSPFVRKTGDVFCVQMGSYQDFSTAKRHAQELKSLGYDVWIYQQ